METTFVAGFGPIANHPSGREPFQWPTLTRTPGDEAATPSATGTGPLAPDMTLAEAAQSTFGSDRWPGDVREPYGWLELLVLAPHEISRAVRELRDAGHQVLRYITVERTGQTAAILLSPEGLLTRVSFTPASISAGRVA